MIAKITPIIKLPRTMPDSFSYLIEGSKEELKNKKYQFVEIDFNNKKVIGIITDIEPDPHLPRTLKKIGHIFSSKIPIFYVQMAECIKNQCFVSMSTALKHILPSSIKNSDLKLFEYYTDIYKTKNKQTSDMFVQYYTNSFKEKTVINNISYHANEKEQILILSPTKTSVQNIAKILEKNKINFHLWKNTKKDWANIIKNKPQIIIGTRSALFSPFTNLKTIIIENENSPYYKSEKTPKYDTINLVSCLATYFNAKTIYIGTAPTIQTKAHLTNICIEKTKIKNPKIIDMKLEKDTGNYGVFSNQLIEDIRTNIEKTNIFLFLNRKGYATAIFCQHCLWQPECPECKTNLIYYTNNYLICHWCRHKEIMPPLCPECNSHDIKLKGKGIQKIDLEIKKLFNTDNITIDKDSPTEINYSKNSIIIGTEYAIDKINWEKIGMIAVIDGDYYKHIPNYKSAEEAFILIKTLHSKSIENKSLFSIQTHNPDDAFIKSIETGKDKIFYDLEIKLRKMLHYPPFSKIIKITYKHKDEKKAIGEAMHIYHRLIKHTVKKDTKYEKSVEISKPYASYPRRKNGKYIFHIAIKIKSKQNEIFPIIREKVPPEWTIDNSPLNLM